MSDVTETQVDETQVDENTGDTAEGAATENTEQQEQPTGPTDEEIAAAVEQFMAKVAEVMASDARDTATGVLSEEQLSQVKVAYGELPAGKARTQAKTWVNEQVGKGIENADAAQARSYYLIKQKSLTAARSASTTVAKPKVDPVDAFVEEVAALYLAPWAVQVPDGMPEDWGDKVQALAEKLTEQVPVYAGWVDAVAAMPEDADESTRPEEPEVSEVVKRAVRIARGRSANVRRKKASGESGESGASRAPYTGTRRDIGKHIREALESAKGEGKTFLTLTEIGNFRSTEYGSDKPSSGAIQARLFPTGGRACTLTGIAPEIVNGKRGARLAS